ncbi:hypothetical protein PBRA_007391 [Plasmodiophora brassicae]|uniref:Arrestin-like N-terminal domain-containing protein n=1 Tax=Plasmodiophora brassicae TaxID=37360 RepID=A0A0G4IWH3_PLABS|nr:hypothetical protein PBRA_007391 [Plasmodiophora brassicae]
MPMKCGDVTIVVDGGNVGVHPGQQVTGKVVFGAVDGRPCAPRVVRLVVEGTAHLTLSPKTVGLFEAFYSSLRPVVLQNRTITITEHRPLLPSQATEFPFSFDVDACGEQRVLPSFKGKLVKIRWTVSCYTGRGFIPSAPKAVKEFLVVANPPFCTPEPIRSPFKSHGYCQNTDDGESQVDLEIDIEGFVESTSCDMRSQPLQGELSVLRSTKRIQSVVLRLNRIESIVYSEGDISERSEVSSLEIADGNIARGLPIPIHFLWPRGTCCPTLRHEEFSVSPR